MAESTLEGWGFVAGAAAKPREPKLSLPFRVPRKKPVIPGQPEVEVDINEIGEERAEKEQIYIIRNVHLL